MRFFSIAQGIATTPFLTGLFRTLPQLTPGFSPDMLDAAFRGVHCSPESESPPPAASGSGQISLSAQLSEQSKHESAQPPTGSCSDHAEGATFSEAEGTQFPDNAADSPGAWAELEDLTPGPRHHSQPSNITVWDSPLGSSAPGSALSSRPAHAETAQSAVRGRQDAGATSSLTFAPTRAAEHSMCSMDAAVAQEASAQTMSQRMETTHKKCVSWGSNTEADDSQAATAAERGETGLVQDAESTGSASPFTAADSAGLKPSCCPLSSQGSNQIQVSSTVIITCLVKMHAHRNLSASRDHCNMG